MKKSRVVLITVVFLLIIGILMTSTSYMPALNHNTPFTEPVKEETSVLSFTIGIEITADMDDDWWKYSKPDGPWRHYTHAADNLARNYTDYDAYGQMRFQLNIPQGSTIEFATLSFYLVTAGAGTITIKRIAETNVGPLEQDTSIPSTTDLYSSFIAPGDIEDIFVESESLALMVQDQVNLPGWQSGYYFGVQLSSDTASPTSFADYEYMEAQFVAYMNITYLTDEEPAQQAQDYDHDLHIPVQSDLDDDWWRWNMTSESWEHRIWGTEIVAGNTPPTNNFGQMRFPITIPQGCTVNFATLNLYFTFNGNITISIKRIDEINVGPLEEDIEKPNTTDVHTSTIFAGTQTGWVTSNNIASMIQDQLNLDGWEEDYHIGFQLVVTTPDTIQAASWYDYQHASGSPAYLNVTYTSKEVGWLSDWQYRKKIVLQRTIGSGVNQTIPISLWQGLGSDKGFEAHLNDHSRPDFGDVRFTSDDGQHLLRYYLNETVGDTSGEYFTDDAVSIPWLSSNVPSLWYDSVMDRTYVVFEGDLSEGGDNLDPHICYYDHTTNSWSAIYWIATSPLNDWYGGDTHGPPSLWIDNDGYIHVLYGAHASRVIQHEKSDYPNDISSFSPATDPCSATWNPSYPHTHYDSTNDVIHLFYRGYTDGRYIVYQNSTDNGDTWSTPQTIVYMGITGGISNRPYPGVSAFTDNEILHIAFHNHSMYPASHAGAEHDFFYVQFNVTNGHVYNVNGYDFGVMADPDEVQNCRYYEYPYPNGTRSGVPDLYVDNENNPWIFYHVGDQPIIEDPYRNPSTFTLRYSYWNSTSGAWQSDDITTHWVSGSSAAAMVWTSDNITIWTNSNPSGGYVYRWTWDGSDWTNQGAITVTADDDVSWPSVPANYRDGNHTEFQVAFGEYTLSLVKVSCWAWGDGGILGRTEQDMAMFNVELVGNLSSSSQTIYVYYGKNIATSTSQELSINPEPKLNLLYWGPEETFDIDAPFNVQEPMISNLDQESHMCARAKEYQIETVLSDIDGFANIEYIELSLFSDNRVNEYWTIRYHQNTNSFSEQKDLFNYIELNESTSYATGLGITLTVVFDITINWNHPDITNTDIKCYAVDEASKVDIDYYETDWDIETRLDISSGLFFEDGLGTSDRGDPNSYVLAYGTIEYLGSSIHPLTSEIDVYVLCTDISMTAWEATNYDQVSGEFSVSVQSADEVGQNTYIVKVVRQGEGAEGFNLLHESCSADYITDRVQAIISVDEAASTSEYITIRLDLEYEYDHESVIYFSVRINKNGEIWKIVDEKTFTDTRSMSDNNTYSIAFVVEKIHGLYLSTDYGSVIVLAGDGGSDSNSNVPDSSDNALGSIKSVIRLVLQFSSVLIMGGFSYIEIIEIVMNDTMSLFFSNDIMVVSIIFSVISLTSFQIHKSHSDSSSKKSIEIFRRFGGLRVDTLLLSKSYSDGLFLKMSGQEFACKVLSYDPLKGKERIQTHLATGGKTNQLIRLLSTPLADVNTEFLLIGFVWEPTAEDM